MFKLKIIQAKFGDCFIVEYGNARKPKYMLIDGGPGGVYSDYLRAELLKIHNSGGQVDLMLLSHIDGDHIVGLIDLLEELKQNAADEEQGIIAVKELWVNTFSQTIARETNLTQALHNMLLNVNNLASTLPSTDLALKSVLQGDTLKRNAMLLNIPINKTSNNDIISCETISESIALDNLKVTVIGPNKENLDKLKEEWLEWIRRHEAKILTADRELLKQIDRSVPNLSSIMFLMESAGKRILFTGDGRGDFILEGLQTVGLLDSDGKIHVDVFKVPHHGSVRNTTEDFFDKIMADTYIISADGRHDNPDFETLAWIVKSAHDQQRQIQLICTNETGSSKKLLKQFKESEYGYRLEYLPEGEFSMQLTLQE
jgi:beta-lactamase superfamily II metal-dependent hydrolase